MFHCGKKKGPSKLKLAGAKLEPVEMTLCDMNLKLNLNTMHWENKKALASLLKPEKTINTDPNDLSNAKNSGFDELKEEKIRLEREKLNHELEDLENHLQNNIKELVLIEIRNEVLKRMIFEETEKYHKYADYEF